MTSVHHDLHLCVGLLPCSTSSQLLSGTMLPGGNTQHSPQYNLRTGPSLRGAKSGDRDRLGRIPPHGFVSGAELCQLSLGQSPEQVPTASH